MSTIQLKLAELRQLNVSQGIQDLLLDDTVRSAHQLVNNDPKKLRIAYINAVVDSYSEQYHLSKNKAKETLKKMSDADLEKIYRNVHMYDHNALLPMTIKDPNGGANDVIPYLILAKKDGRKLDPAQAVADDATELYNKDGHFIIQRKNGLPPINGRKYTDTPIGVLKSDGFDKNGSPRFHVATIDIDVEKLKSSQK